MEITSIVIASASILISLATMIFTSNMSSKDGKLIKNSFLAVETVMSILAIGSLAALLASLDFAPEAQNFALQTAFVAGILSIFGQLTLLNIMSKMPYGTKNNALTNVNSQTENEKALREKEEITAIIPEESVNYKSPFDNSQKEKSPVERFQSARAEDDYITDILAENKKLGEQLEKAQDLNRRIERTMKKNDGEKLREIHKDVNMENTKLITDDAGIFRLEPTM